MRMNRLTFFILAVLNGSLMVPGIVIGTIAHRFIDGWRMARRNLDRLDDKAIEYLKGKQ